jgi:hypothetical protein
LRARVLEHYDNDVSVEMAVVCGADLLPRLGRVLRERQLVVCVVNRPLAAFDAAAFVEEQRLQHGARIVFKDTKTWQEEGVAMSSTAVRAAVRSGDETALRRMLWPSVVEYHRRHHLAYELRDERGERGAEEDSGQWRQFVSEACEGLWLPEQPALRCGAPLGSGRTAGVAAGALGGRAVAVKRLWLTGPYKETRLRAQSLAREAHAARRLAVQCCEAHVCYALGAAWLDGSRGVALVMPLFSCSLRDVLADLDDASAALVVEHTARGMRAVARAKLLHRDLHCGNVLVVRSVEAGSHLLTRAAIADFGLSKSESDPTGLSR